FFIGDVNDFCLRRQIAHELMRGLFAAIEGGKPARIIRLQPELGLTKVIGRPQPAIHGGTHMVDSEFFVAATIIAVSNMQPFPVPAFEVVRYDLAARLKDFTDCASAFLSFTQAAPE